MTNDQPDILNVGPLLINKDSHEVKTIKGDVIQLTALEFGILYLLASHPNRVFSADDIFERGMATRKCRISKNSHGSRESFTG